MTRLLGVIVCMLALISASNANSDQTLIPKESEGKIVLADKNTGRRVLIMPGQFLVASNGETTLFSDSQKFNIRVTFRTHEEQIVKPSDHIPDEITSNCTYTRYPCSILDSLKIIVGENPIHISRSVFCDLADINHAEIKIEGNKTILILEGGDTSGSYIAKIEFNDKRVIRRIVSTGDVPDKILEETIYHVAVMGD